MGRRKLLVGFLVGFTLLVGTNSAMAAMWDQHCEAAIENLQRLQQQVAAKKQEVEQARVIEAIPSNFISSELRTTTPTNRGVSQTQNDLILLFQNVEFAVAQFSQSCLNHNRIIQR